MTPNPSQSASTSTEARLRGALQELFDFVADGWGDDYPDAMRRAESALASPPPAPESSDREAELREQVIEAARRLSESEQVSGSTLPPGMHGIGGQQMTGWVRAEPLEDLLLAAYQLRAEEQRNADLRAPQPQVSKPSPGQESRAMSEFTPNQEAVRRISAHLLGEDMRNVKAAVESFANGYKVVPPSESTQVDESGSSEPSTPFADQGASVFIVCRNPGGEVMAVFNNRDDAYENLDIRTGRGARPDLEDRYYVESWHVSGEARAASPKGERASAQDASPAPDVVEALRHTQRLLTELLPNADNAALIEEQLTAERDHLREILAAAHRGAPDA